MMTKFKKILLAQVLFLCLMGLSTLSYSQTSTTTKVEEVKDDSGKIIETITTTTTTITEKKIETSAAPITTYGGGFTEWHEMNCDQPVPKIPVKRIQEKLKQRGYYRGAIDSILGPRTRNAVLKFRIDNGFSPTFLVDECILGLMGIVIPPQQL